MISALASYSMLGRAPRHTSIELLVRSWSRPKFSSSWDSCLRCLAVDALETCIQSDDQGCLSEVAALELSWLPDVSISQICFFHQGALRNPERIMTVSHITTVRRLG